MLYSIEIDMIPQEVLDGATVFFGDAGLGLKLVEKSRTSISFEGGGGHVSISTQVGDRTKVELFTREWDFQVKSFMEELKGESWCTGETS